MEIFTEANFDRQAGERRVLIIGFDTEYQTRQSQKEDGTSFLENEVLSYQYSCKLIDEIDDDYSISWSGIHFPAGLERKDRISLEDFVKIVLSSGVVEHASLPIPKIIYLVAHFTRADVPGFSEFQDEEKRDGLNLDNLRSSFVNVKKDIDLELQDLSGGKPHKLSIKIRDTITLAPAGARSLEDLGSILDFQKIKLSDDPELEHHYKTHMKQLLEDDPELFRRYAVRDADICTSYTEKMIRLNQQKTGSFVMPLTLTSIGVDLITRFWAQNGMDPNTVVGKETVEKRTWSNREKRYVTRYVDQFVPQLFWSEDFLTECFHGGRNEQFWFGSAPPGIWYDYDLTSAYPSAMALIGQANWRDIKQITDTAQLLNGRYGPMDTVFANVDFSFPENVRFPVLPVRTENGLIFPRSGSSSTHISEILLAKELGAEIKLIEGRVIASEGGGLVGNRKGLKRPFVEFTSYCIEERGKFPKKSLDNLFWKEIANSTYGKTAQGLRERRIYDLRAEDTKRLGKSSITNPGYAAFITAICRGVLGEIMNNLPNSVEIFSVTTDGFLTTATDAQMQRASQGALGRFYKRARSKLNGEGQIYEVKHVVRRPLGWRTRAQATLEPATVEDFEGQEIGYSEDTSVVLAKGGIKLKHRLSKPEQNKEILDLFFNRQPGDIMALTLGMGIRQMYEEGSDFVDKEMIKRLSMEFDWKRRPSNPRDKNVILDDGSKHCHLSFESVPWDNIDHFVVTREHWQAYQKDSPSTLKSCEDLLEFARYLESRESSDEKSRPYLKKKNGDLLRLRRDIVIAHKLRKAGTHIHKDKAFGTRAIRSTKKMKANLLAPILEFVLDMPVSVTDVYNARKKMPSYPTTFPGQTELSTLLSVSRKNYSQSCGSRSFWLANLRSV